MTETCEWCSKDATWSGVNSRTAEPQYSCHAHLSMLFAWDVHKRKPLRDD